MSLGRLIQHCAAVAVRCPATLQHHAHLVFGRVQYSVEEACCYREGLEISSRLAEVGPPVHFEYPHVVYPQVLWICRVRLAVGLVIVHLVLGVRRVDRASPVVVVHVRVQMVVPLEEGVRLYLVEEEGLVVDPNLVVDVLALAVDRHDLVVALVGLEDLVVADREAQGLNRGLVLVAEVVGLRVVAPVVSMRLELVHHDLARPVRIHRLVHNVGLDRRSRLQVPLHAHNHSSQHDSHNNQCALRRMSNYADLFHAVVRSHEEHYRARGLYVKGNCQTLATGVRLLWESF